MKMQKLDFDVVTGPAIAGAILAAPLALQGKKIFVYPEKIMSGPYYREIIEMEFGRGYAKVLEGKRVLVVEDIITTGKSVVKTMEAIYKCNGTPIRVIAIWNRTGWTNDFCEVESLINERVESWDQDKHGNCPDCHAGIPLMAPKTMEIIIR